eukprot:CAMPEP_0180525428 /NCGR_PEP_ID=MMETSP1036_2-20121128/59160_1 /TAXON_ID=632150 /ORGANISM="Azadinium spinosum, Strain 3D9" /LENGTH=86 /DNA_ID=CAMNT_0022538721 /DNA_START=380 /DNA_END=640 /DNA_ORIENTATION=-
MHGQGQGFYLAWATATTQSNPSIWNSGTSELQRKARRPNPKALHALAAAPGARALRFAPRRFACLAHMSPSAPGDVPRQSASNPRP